MPWLQLTVETNAERAEHIEDLFLEAGALSVTYRDAADQPVLEPGVGETPLWQQTRVVGLFPGDCDARGLRAQLAAQLPAESVHTLRLNPLEDRDWTRAWMDDYHPLHFGDRLWIYPEGYEPEDPQAVNIRLDPGLAFGTGTHPTTALCLEWLDAHPPQDLDVLDYGCGSGILAVAAALLGARHAWAVDNDPQALIATRDNAHKNGVDESISVAAPQALEPQPYDLIVANILAGPLIDLAPELARLAKPGARIVLSGILDHQANQVSAAYGQAFDMAQPQLRDGWARLDGVRKSASV